MRQGSGERPEDTSHFRALIGLGFPSEWLRHVEVRPVTKEYAYTRPCPPFAIVRTCPVSVNCHPYVRSGILTVVF